MTSAPEYNFDDCNPCVSFADPTTKTPLPEKLLSEGWCVRRMKVDGGCWEVYGTTPEGARVESTSILQPGENYWCPVVEKSCLVLKARTNVTFLATNFQKTNQEDARALASIGY